MTSGVSRISDKVISYNFHVLPTPGILLELEKKLCVYNKSVSDQRLNFSLDKNIHKGIMPGNPQEQQ